VTEGTLTPNALLMTATNEDALEAAVREHARLVYRIAYSVSRNHHDAEDATQETFLRILRYRRKLQGIDDPKMWIARIAWRVAVGQEKKRPAGGWVRRKSGDAISHLRVGGQSTEESAASAEMARILESLIRALPEPLRGAITLSTVGELLPSEVARVLETSEASVRSRLFRARQILRSKLKALEVQHGITRSR